MWEYMYKDFFGDSGPLGWELENENWELVTIIRVKGYQGKNYRAYYKKKVGE